MEAWLIELGKGIGKAFLNPVLYWVIILVLVTGSKRIKRQRRHFGVKIFGYLSEMKGTWLPSLLFGVIFSIAILLAGIVFSPFTILVLSLAMILLSMHFRLSTLSASYTIGLAYILLLFSPVIFENLQVTDNFWLTETNFTGLTLLLGLVLVAEAYHMQHVKRKETYPSLTMSERGYWIGRHHLRKLSVIPIFLLVPEGLIEPFAPYWPILSIGEGTYGIILLPFLTGFSILIRGSLAPAAGKYLAKRMYIIALLVILFSILDYFVMGMTLAALLIGLLGREFIIYRFKVQDKSVAPYYQPHANGAKVLAVIPGTPADRLEILPGEIVKKVNDTRVKDSDEFYEALQKSGAYFKLEILDDNEEIRFVQGAFYEGDHHKLGIIFLSEPYRKNKKTI